MASCSSLLVFGVIITQARPRRKKAGAEHPDLEGADGKSGVRLVQ